MPCDETRGNDPMRILVIGSGGREHALVWKLQQSPRVEKIFCAPGNGGIAREPRAESRAIDAGAAFADLIAFAQEEKIDLTVVGPESSLAEGIVDHFEAAGLRIVGPSRAAARLESSKAFAKDFMSRHGIPTADFFVCDSADQGLDLIQRSSYEYPVAIKADGLAAGKGVVLAQDFAEAEATILNFMTEKSLGDAGARVVIEECLQGRECSFMVFTDGEHYLPMVPAQDHKRVFDADQGPNTGGMGAFSDDSILTPGLRTSLLLSIVEPTLRGMKEEGAPFKGILYCGLMLTELGPKVLEFNCRFGDPETQPVLMRMKSDLMEIFEGIAAGALDATPLSWSPDPAVCVVMASGGYPGAYQKGKAIQGIEKADAMEDVKVFHAGTKMIPGASSRFETNGGRILGVTATGADLQSAVAQAYRACALIQFDGVHYRRDIAAQFLHR